MKYLLDTDVFSMAARDGNAMLRARFQDLPLDDLGISAVTVGEIEHGLAKNRPSPRTLARIDVFRAALTVLPIDAAVGVRFGRLRDELRRIGQPIGPNDFWVAAHALAADLTFVTGNEREFARVPTLRVENWMR